MRLSNLVLLTTPPQAPNRRVQRLMEKENKKLRETAKKKRNETVRVRGWVSIACSPYVVSGVHKPT